MKRLKVITVRVVQCNDHNSWYNSWYRSKIGQTFEVFESICNKWYTLSSTSVNRYYSIDKDGSPIGEFVPHHTMKRNTFTFSNEKNPVKKWKWLYRNEGGVIKLTDHHYATLDDVTCACIGVGVVLRSVEETMIEVPAQN